MKGMDISEYPVDRGRYLIEASAGTGKTWTITHLFLRLVLKGVPVSGILVTTFSKAAAAELKERIVEVLHEELAATAPDAGSGETALPRRLLLQLAVSSIDEMTIGTIHGFCQKMLREFALETGASDAVRLIADETPYQERLVQAFCRRKFYGKESDPDFSPADFLKTARLAGRPVDHVVPGEGRKKYCGEVLDYVRAHIRAEKEKDGVLSFDDLIAVFHDAVMRDPALAARVGNRYRAVFVDEFQDTDRLQFEIFDRCFPRGGETLFYMIGDPKQAIYGFRGADIHAYLEARNTVDRRFRLTRNFRSTPPMIEAVNRIFSGGTPEEGHETEGVFLQEDIPYIAVVPGRSAAEFPNMEKSALRLRHYIGSKEENEQRIYEDVVREIAWLLSDACTMKIDEEGVDAGGRRHVVSRALLPSDIAVLVPKHAQAAHFLRLLNRRGIAASACKSGRVYETGEAEVMLLLLHCMLHPEERFLRGLLLSPFFRFSADRLLALEGKLETVAEALRRRGEDWREHGLPAAVLGFLDAPLLEPCTPRVRLLEGADGERALANCLQIMELLYEKEMRDKLPPEDILVYLNQAVNGLSDGESSASTDGEIDDNPEQLRLEKDSAAVQILTMFAAKGLEFPVVFVPFPARTAGTTMLRDEVAYRQVAEDGVTLDFAKRDRKIRESAFAEALRSQLRLLYVALTRAGYVTYLYTQELPENPDGRKLNFFRSAQGVILTRPEVLAEKGAAYFNDSKRLMPDPPAEWFRKLVREKRGRWEVFEYYPEREPERPRAETPPEEELTAGTPPRIPESWRMMSFSAFKAMLAHTAGPETESAADYDRETSAGDAAPEEAAPEPSGAAGTVNSFRNFPRGARVGTMVHKAFQNMGRWFSAFDPAAEAVPAAAREAAVRELRLYGYASEALEKALFDGIARTLRTPLPGLGAALWQMQRYTQELEFFMDAPRSLDLRRIMTILRGSASEPVRRRLEAVAEPTGGAGVLNGQIDLIFEHGGRYYIADWKTNDLGPRDADYAPERIAAVMVRELYVLQAYLYSAALLRMMRRKGIADDRFGGVYYLFPRGMTPGGANGIWFDRPPAACLEALLGLFGEEEKDEEEEGGA